MHDFDTFENRLSRLHTWIQQAKKEKTPKKLGSKCATVARYSMLYRFLWNALQREGVSRQKGENPKKNSAQMRHSCALFDTLSIFVQCAATRRHQQAKKRKNPKNTVHMRHSCTVSGRKPPQKPCASTSSPSPSQMERGPGGKKDAGYLYKGPCSPMASKMLFFHFF